MGNSRRRGKPSKGRKGKPTLEKRRSGVAQPAPPAPPADLEDWGAAADEESLDEGEQEPEIAEIPAFAMGDQPSEPPPELLAIGAPPAGADEIQAWGYRVLATMAWDAMRDKAISQETRRRRVPSLLAAAAKFYPDAVKAEIAAKIDRRDREVTERKRAKAAARLEARPPPGSAKVIPIRRDG